MTYKEALFFTGKCLTINHEEHNKKLVEEDLKNDKIDWEAIVKVSTSHYVFPALYCNIKKANLLHYLPEDLVAYMKHITDLNRERNTQIIAQAKEINDLLLANDITPVFLKGTGNLLEGLYDDIAERMVGDIDFLVNNNQLNKCISILKQNGYSTHSKNKIDTTVVSRHYPKMIKKDRVSIVEVHYKMVSRKKFTEFNFSFIEKNVLKKNLYHVLSDEDKIIMTSINKHLNDKSDLLFHFGLRNSYDLFLLSLRTDTLNAIKKITHFKNLNPFLFSSFQILGSPKHINFIDNRKARYFFQKQIQNIENSNKIKQLFIKKRIQFTHRVSVLIKAIYNKEYRNYIINRIKSNF
ncbi:nucleotidyltransferase domain-containing protein [Tenacibaculum sp. M341]|uniref:nucleotidyltransferase domain-containing protein n=1 Tax=Tenacibaculum sp. M341 TaxID=2530339 RepID=UPI00104D6912|nr:nucleotidyltransferase family protein [Tenacibaculum sp. M341]TCI85343.1 hypothetical protein EYW44_17375 [Tenacibaculum sp. M341]